MATANKLLRNNIKKYFNPSYKVFFLKKLDSNRQPTYFNGLDREITTFSATATKSHN